MQKDHKNKHDETFPSAEETFQILKARGTSLTTISDENKTSDGVEVMHSGYNQNYTSTDHISSDSTTQTISYLKEFEAASIQNIESKLTARATSTLADIKIDIEKLKSELKVFNIKLLLSIVAIMLAILIPLFLSAKSDIKDSVEDKIENSVAPINGELNKIKIELAKKDTLN